MDQKSFGDNYSYCKSALKLVYRLHLEMYSQYYFWPHTHQTAFCLMSSKNRRPILLLSQQLLKQSIHFCVWQQHIHYNLFKIENNDYLTSLSDCSFPCLFLIKFLQIKLEKVVKMGIFALMGNYSNPLANENEFSLSLQFSVDAEQL